MTLKERWLHCLPAGIFLAAIVLSVLWLVRPVAFLEMAPVDQATDFYIYTTDAGESHEFLSARPEKEDMLPLLNLLEEGVVRLKGRAGNIQWAEEDTLYHISSYHIDNNQWVQDAAFDLCTDGMVYVSHDWLGYFCYQVSDCELDAVYTQLERLLCMEGPAKE